MLTPAAKRRRAEAASATLARPFRSPSVRDKVAHAAKLPREISRTVSGAKADKAVKRDAESCPTSRKVAVSSAASPEPSRKRPRPPSRSNRACEIAPTDQPFSLSDLVDQFNRDLDSGDQFIADTRGAAHFGRQRAEAGASRERYSAENQELHTLIIRWRTAARLAADDVFTLISDRVDRLGGVKAWLAMGSQSTASECGDSRRGARRTDSDQRTNSRVDDSDQSNVEDEDDTDGCADGKTEEEDTQNFTMPLMLANLNVDPDLLGYDEVEERWKD